MSLPEHLYIRPLTSYDVEQCLSLEEDGFPENERCSKEKLEYRLNVCPELCSGLFIRKFESTKKKHHQATKKGTDADGDENSMKETKQENDDEDESSSDDDDNDDDYYHNSRFVSEQLIGQIISTKIFDDSITDRSMEIPKFQTNTHYIVDSEIEGNDQIGHREDSSTIGIHSLVIHSEYKKLGLGTLLLKDYIQKLSQQEVGERVVIIAHQELIPFYKRIGFVDQGKSDCKWGGESWNSLCLVLLKDDQDD